MIMVHFLRHLSGVKVAKVFHILVTFKLCKESFLFSCNSV